jgi:hypothetical protein
MALHLNRVLDFVPDAEVMIEAGDFAVDFVFMASLSAAYGLL